jgi:hypothetical protein
LEIEEGKNSMKKLIFSVGLLGLMIGSVMSQEQTDTETPAPVKHESKVDISGFGFLMFGQVYSGYIGDVGDPISHLWQNFGEADLFATSNPNNWFTSKIGVKLATVYPGGFNAMEKSSYYMKFQPTVPVAEGIFHWNFDMVSLAIESGLFQYNFNPDIKNLGNYLYRSTAYPLYVQTRIDYPWADLMGLRCQVAVLDKKLKFEALLDSKFDHPPWYDWNLGFTASYNLNKVLDLGAGVCFDHLLSVNEYETMARYQLIQSIDTAKKDTSYYNYRSTKIDLRVTFDPKPLFGNIELFGSQDCKVYAEMGILGLKDYQYYTKDLKPDLMHRIPFLAGINLPGFKIIDVVSFEVEWFNDPYPNVWAGQNAQGYDPRPLQTYDTAWIDNYRNKDNLKWTVYLKKKISNFEIMGFAANDHYIYPTFNIENLPCFEQSLRKPGNWHWYIKLQYNL